MAEMVEDRAPVAWWAGGNYTGDNCPHCGWPSQVRAVDNDGRQRVVCLRCDWEPAAGTYRREIDTPDGQEHPVHREADTLSGPQVPA
jgi:hypothetical protein